MKIKMITLASIIILLGGCFVNHENTDNLDNAKETVKSYLENNYENVETIQFDEGDFTSPMGGLLVTGVINGKAEFSVSLDNDLNVGSVGEGEGFPEEKEECKVKECDY